MNTVRPSEICDNCGQEVFVGEWPFCPHGFGNNLDEPMEGYDDWQLSAGDDDVPHVTTRGQRRAIMRANGLEYHEPRDAKMRGRIFIDLGRKTR